MGMLFTDTHMPTHRQPSSLFTPDFQHLDNF